MNKKDTVKRSETEPKQQIDRNTPYISCLFFILVLQIVTLCNSTLNHNGGWSFTFLYV